MYKIPEVASQLLSLLSGTSLRTVVVVHAPIKQGIFKNFLNDIFS